MVCVKGVTPLIASVFLIVLVVTLASLVTTWITTVVKETQNTVGERAENSIDCSNAEVTIDNVFVSIGSGRAIIRNSGFVDDLTIETAQIFNSDGRSSTADNVPMNDFNKGSVQTLLFNDENINCALFYKLVVTTNCGTVYAEFTGQPDCV